MSILRLRSGAAPHLVIAFLASALTVLVTLGPAVGEWALPSHCAHTEHAAGEMGPAVTTHADAGAHEHDGNRQARTDLPTLADAESSECGHCPADQCAVQTSCAATAYGLTAVQVMAPALTMVGHLHTAPRRHGPLESAPIPTTPPPRIMA